MTFKDELRGGGVPCLRDELEKLCESFHGQKIHERTVREIESRTAMLLKEAEERGEIELPQTLVTAGELRAALGRHTPGYDAIPDHAAMVVVDHEAKASVDGPTRRLEIKLTPVAEWQYDGRRVRVPRDDVDLGLNFYRSRGVR